VLNQSVVLNISINNQFNYSESQYSQKCITQEGYVFHLIRALCVSLKFLIFI